MTEKNEPKIILFHSSIDGEVIIKDHISVGNEYGCARLENFLNVFGIEWPEEGIDSDLLHELEGVEFKAVTGTDVFRGVKTTKIAQYVAGSGLAETTEEADSTEPVETAEEADKAGESDAQQIKKMMEEVKTRAKAKEHKQ